MIKFLKVNIDKVVLITIVLLSITSFIFYFLNGQNLAFNDAKSHMNIARRVFDNTTPGLTQLGSSWLPLLHVLMLPFIWNTYLWHSGIAGAIVNMVSYILASIFIYKTVLLLTNNRKISFFSTLIYALNPNALYMQTTGMTEILFTCTLSGSIFFLTKWYKTKNFVFLLSSSLFTFLTGLTRYEGWALVVFSIPVVFLLTLDIFKKIKKAEGYTVIFGTLALLSIILWLGYQWVIYGSPVFFLHNEFSSVGQTKVAVSYGLVPSYHRLDLSILSFWYAVSNNTGYITMWIWTISVFVIGIYTIIKKNISVFLILLLLLTPYLFEIYALYSGAAPINVVQIYPYRSFNVRFGLYLFPAISIFIGYLLFIMQNKIIKIFLVLAITGQLSILYFSGPIATLTEDGVANSRQQQDVSKYFKRNAPNGYILASAAIADPVMFDSGLDLKRFVSEGGGLLWKRALKNPYNTGIVYILVSKNELKGVRDGVYKELFQQKSPKGYRMVLDNSDYSIYKKFID